MLITLLQLIKYQANHNSHYENKSHSKKKKKKRKIWQLLLARPYSTSQLCGLPRMMSPTEKKRTVFHQDKLKLIYFNNKGSYWETSTYYTSHVDCCRHQTLAHNSHSLKSLANPMLNLGSWIWDFKSTTMAGISSVKLASRLKVWAAI